MKNNGTTRAVNWKNGHMELGGGAKRRGWTVRSNVNEKLIPEIKRWNKESAKIINQCIKTGDVKGAIKEMQNAAGRNREIREVSQHHDKIIYDANGTVIYWWEEGSDRFEEVEH